MAQQAHLRSQNEALNDEDIHLHYVIDEWLTEISRSHIRGKAGMVRYADDIVFTFGYRHEAKRFYSAWVGLATNVTKTNGDSLLQVTWRR